jgi:hypothetical protein
VVSHFKCGTEVDGERFDSGSVGDNAQDRAAGFNPPRWVSIMSTHMASISKRGAQRIRTHGHIGQATQRRQAPGEEQWLRLPKGDSPLSPRAQQFLDPCTVAANITPNIRHFAPVISASG